MTFFEITNKANVGKIRLFGEIIAGSATAFERQLEAIGKIARIELFVNSPGGCVFAGFQIHNLLARHPARIIATIDGLAASAASFICMAANEIVMLANSAQLVHDPAGHIQGGSADDMERMADRLRKVRDAMALIYAKRTKQSRDKILAMMTAETYLDAAECVRLGFADRLEQPVRIAAQFDLSRYKTTRLPPADPAAPLMAAWFAFLKKPGVGEAVVASLSPGAPPDAWQQLWDTAQNGGRLPTEIGLAQTKSWDAAVTRVNNGRAE